MVNYKKGIKVAKSGVNKFTFNDRGQSKFGASETDSHELKGLTKIHDVMTVEGDLVLQNRLAGTLFGAPQIDGQTAEGQAALQDLKDNAETDYEGFLIYLTNASTTISPFLDDQKFYFCESGTWYPSPFLKDDGTQVVADSDTDGDGVDDATDAFPTDPAEWTDADGDLLGANAEASLGTSDLVADDANYNTVHDSLDIAAMNAADSTTVSLTIDYTAADRNYNDSSVWNWKTVYTYGTVESINGATFEEQTSHNGFRATPDDGASFRYFYSANGGIPTDYLAAEVSLSNAEVSGNLMPVFVISENHRNDESYYYNSSNNYYPDLYINWGAGRMLLEHDKSEQQEVKNFKIERDPTTGFVKIWWAYTNLATAEAYDLWTLYFDGSDPSADFDGDGTANPSDAFPVDATETTDTDGDGVGDNADAFPNDPTETADSDGDGVGDNADAFPNDASETTDTDGDGVGDNADLFPNDPTESTDVNYNTLGDSGDITAMNATGSTTMAISFDHTTPDAMKNSYSTYGYGWNYKTVRTLGTVESINGTSFQEQVTHAGYGSGGSYQIFVDFYPDQRLNHPIADVSISNAEVSGNLMPVFVISENYRNDESSYYNSSNNYYPDMYVDWGKGRFLLEHDKSEQQEVKNFKFERDPATGLMKVWWGYTDVATLEANDTWTLYFDEATDPDTIYTAAYNNQDTNLNTINDWLDFDAINTVSSSAISLSFNHLDSKHKETTAYNNQRSVHTLGTLESMNNDYFPRRFLQQEDHAGYGNGGDEYLYWYDIDQHFDNNNKANSQIANVSLSHAEVSGSSMPVYVMSYIHNPYDATMDDFRAPHLLADFGLGRVNLSHSVTEASAQGVDYKTFKFERDPSTTNWKIWYGYGTASEVETANSWVLYLDQANSIWPDTPPELDLNGFDAHVVPLDAQGTYIDPGYTALDIVDGDITSYVTASGNVDLTTEGTYQISYEVTDSRGNTSSRTRDVTVATSSAPAGFSYEGLIYHQDYNPEGRLDSYIYTNLEVYDLSTGYSGSALQFTDYDYQYSDFQFEEGKTYGIKYTDQHSDGDVEFVFTENHNNTRQALAPDTTSPDMLNIPFKYARFTWPVHIGNENIDMTTHWFKLLWMDKTLYINDQAVMFYDSNDGLWKGSQDTDGSYLNDSFEHFSSVTIGGEKCVFPTGMTEPHSPVQLWNGFFYRGFSDGLGDARIRVSDIESAEYGSSTSYGDQYGHFETEVQPNGDINMTLK